MSHDSFASVIDTGTSLAPNKKCFDKKRNFQRGKSLLGPIPDLTFGPKASTRPDFARDYELDPENQTLKWSRPPENVLVIKKNDEEANIAFMELSSWLISEKKLTVFVETSILSEELLMKDQSFKDSFEKLKPYDSYTEKSRNCSTIDLVVSIGGDGTLLYVASLFQQSMPPVVPFHCGSLGFLTTHDLNTHKETLCNVLEGNACLMLRSRLRCMVERKGESPAPPLHESPSFNGIGEVPENGFNGTTNYVAKPSFLVLNEVVVNRGMSQYLCNLDLYLEGHRITSVQGDGLIISTPTGSTAYAVAAGASMVHPNVPSIMVTPICPHSLSFRPIIVPPGAELKFTVSENARGPASVSFDGRGVIEINQGDYVTIRTSVHPAPCVCKNNPFDDWFDSLSRCLHWNSRQMQKKI